jgi:hypothetical protein
MVTESSRKVQLSGNPFVDTGLAVIAALTGEGGLDHVEDLTLEHLRQIFGDGSELARRNGRLKNFTMVFTNNSLLTNPSVKKSAEREAAYRSALRGLLDEIGNESVAARCESCGAPRSVDFASVCARALKGTGQSKADARAAAAAATSDADIKKLLTEG